MHLALRAALVIGGLLAVPFSTGADPITEGPRQEILVEGHTVYLTIDDHAPASRAAAVAATMRVSAEPAAAESGTRVQADRTPGVLWFNDQYLTAPKQTVIEQESLGDSLLLTNEYAAALAVLVRQDDGQRVREPCGGAVLATRAGDADPRIFLGADAVLDWTYIESYRITDPNEHIWIIDRYDLASIGTQPVWVVNILGVPAFTPDLDGTAADDCLANKAALEDLTDAPFAAVSPNLHARDALCSLALSESDPLATTGDADLSLSPYGGLPAWTDEPCMGAAEPSWNGYCYAGPLAIDADLDGDIDRDDCRHPSVHAPRRYHALLYFDWANLAPTTAPVDHSDPWNMAATNGCQVGTEWSCYSDDDALEGDSHPFHPRVPLHDDVQDCLPQFAGPNPTNHGGSVAGIGGVCDYFHATAPVDVYFSGAARPVEPPARLFRVVDSSGSSAPFHDFYRAYPGYV